MRLSALALVALVLAGCGSTAATSGLEGSAEATGAETSRIEMTTRAAPLVFQASGVVDYERGLMELTAEPAIPLYGAKAGVTGFRLLGRTAYSSWDLDGKTVWTRHESSSESGDPANQLLPGPGSTTKPTDVLRRVLSASDEQKNLGTEEIRGEETTHYRAQVSIEKLLEQMPEAQRPAGDVAEQFGKGTFPVDIWIDGESRLRRIAMTRFSGSSEWSLTLDLFDYGVDVDVEAPPAGELITQERLEELAGPMVVGEAESGVGEEIP
jgi:hypothetical protein